MQDLVNFIPLPPSLLLHLAVDMIIVIALLTTLRWVSGRLAAISSAEALGTQDNFAFGISVAGRMFALCLVLSAAVASSTANDLVQSATTVSLYGLVGLILIKVGRYGHDKLILHKLDKELYIKERNTSVALVDAASAVATAIIIRSIMLWVDGADVNAFFAIFSGFLATLAILLATTRWYEQRYRAQSQNEGLQATLCKGQLALAIQHAGHLLGTALSVSAASNLLVYKPLGYVSNLTSWLIVGLALALLQAAMLMVAKWLVLSGVDQDAEIDQQHNVGVASIELVLSVGIALVMIGLFALAA